MRSATREQVDAWWCRVFGVDGHQLWRDVTVQHPHGLLADYPGWYVAWRGAGAHVSAPAGADPSDVAALAGLTSPELQDPAFWPAFAHQRGLVLRGPSVHHHLDDDPGPDPGVVGLHVDDLAGLRASVAATEWDESGLHHANARLFGVVDGGRLVAAAGLDDWDGAPRDIGVLVAADRRGRGLAARVGGHAASYAVRHHGLARWRALTTNVASTRAAQRLGFEPYATQLAVRPEVSGS